MLKVTACEGMYRICITLITEKDAYYSPLYYMPKQDVCQTCPDFVPFGNECSDAGDCWRGFCACDTGYTGYKCQESRKFLGVLGGSQGGPRGVPGGPRGSQGGPRGSLLEMSAVMQGTAGDVSVPVIQATP